MIRPLILITILFLGMQVRAQFEANYDYSREFTWGVNKNTSSGLVGGLALKLGLEKNEGLFETFAVEFINIKHPKEQKYRAETTGSFYVWGKQNYLFSTRMIYGREKVFFQKAPQQGVQISGGFGGGLAIGFEAPYYILSTSGEYRRFDPTQFTSRSAIQGSGQVFRSISESKIVPGANARASLIFEFGSFRSNVAGLELGVMADAYARKIIIIPTESNRALYPVAFFTLFWGTRR